MLSMSLSSCRRFHPAEVDCRISQISAAHAAFALTVAGSAFGVSPFRGHIYVHLHYGPMTCASPMETSVDRLQKFSFPPLCYPSYGALTLAPAGLSPAEHASLRWTHNRTGRFPASGSRKRLTLSPTEGSHSGVVAGPSHTRSEETLPENACMPDAARCVCRITTDAASGGRVYRPRCRPC